MSDGNHIVVSPKAEISQTTHMHPLVTAAMSGGKIDTDVLRELMELQKDWEKYEAKKAFTAALVELKKNLSSIIDRDAKTDYISRKGGKVAYSYTTMAHAMEVIEPHLIDFGFTLTWVPSTENGNVSVTCKLSHIDGHCEETTISGPPDNTGLKNPLQAIGSAQSYLGRYGSLALLGVVTRDMKCADQNAAANAARAAQDVPDADRNIKAMSTLASVGITKRQAEAHVQRNIEQWTTSDLDSLRDLYSERKALQEG